MYNLHTLQIKLIESNIKTIPVNTIQFEMSTSQFSELTIEITKHLTKEEKKNHEENNAQIGEKQEIKQGDEQNRYLEPL